MTIDSKFPQLVVENKHDVATVNLKTAYERAQANPGSRMVEVRWYDASYLRYELVGYIISYPGDEIEYLTYADIKRMHDEKLAAYRRSKEEKRNGR